MSAAPSFTDFTDADCLDRLDSRSFGRLAFHVSGRIEIFPVNYRLAGRTIVFRTAPGTKLAGTIIASDVAFQVDHIDDESAWSVIAHGRARILETEDELLEASKLPLRPWVQTPTQEYLEIKITRLNGREYRLAPDPLPDHIES
ncbi:MAG: pyridoxamine 5'-phosphate oxidase family protein [Pseudoclavibacter sp.]